MDNLEQDIRKIVESGKDTDYSWNGEDEVPFDTFDSEYVIQELVEYIRNLQKQQILPQSE